MHTQQHVAHITQAHAHTTQMALVSASVIRGNSERKCEQWKLRAHVRAREIPSARALLRPVNRDQIMRK